MRRRPFLRVAGIAAASALAGCNDRPVGGSTTPTTEPSQVTTTAGEEVSIVSSSVDFSAEDGPRVNYRLVNEGSTDATVSVRTVITLDGGDSYEGRAFADVPAGGAVVLEYRVVEYSSLPEDAAADVRAGRGSYEVYLNGEHRGGL